MKIKPIKMISRTRMGSQTGRTSVRISVQEAGYSEEEFLVMMAQGRILKRLNRLESYVDTDCQLYVVETEEEKEEPDEYLDRGHLVELE